MGRGSGTDKSRMAFLCWISIYSWPTAARTRGFRAATWRASLVLPPAGPHSCPFDGSTRHRMFQYKRPVYLYHAVPRAKDVPVYSRTALPEPDGSSRPAPDQGICLYGTPWKLL